MKKLILSALAFFVFAAVALAQDIPAAEVAGGYSVPQSRQGLEPDGGRRQWFSGSQLQQLARGGQ